jgi:subtilisin family serine protease
LASFARDQKRKLTLFKPANILLLITLLFSFINWSPPSRETALSWQEKVEPQLLNSVENQVEFVLFLSEQANLDGAARLSTKQQKGEYVFQTLTKTAQRSQKPILEALARSAVEVRPYWIANMIWVRSDPALIETLALRKDVAKIYANPRVQMDLPKPTQQTAPLAADKTDAIEWNILKVRADLVWNMGYSGQGITVGGQDTGYDWQHPALKNQYRGWDGANANHNYQWHDAIHAPGDGSNPCGYDTQAPCDDNYHGTHTMGTMVGDDGSGNQIGMAPGARWIGCRNMDKGAGTPITYSECYQWFIAPTNLNNQNPRPDLAPDVINNSWSCPASEGCSDPNILLTVVQNVRAAGIVTVHSAGNSGTACSSINTPAAIYDESFTVGNTNLEDNIAASSSRGPVTVDGSNRIKPDVSAPGSNIRSSIPGGSYSWLSGTSMAAPHVAGLVALLLSVRPELSGRPDAIEISIASSAVARTTSENCGGVDGNSIPNNTYGWGRVDAWNAVQSALNTSFIYMPLVIKNP